MASRLITMACVLVACLLAAAPAHAELKIVPGSFTADSYRKDGSVENRAGVHPYRATTNFDVELGPDNEVTGSARNLRVELPAGFVGDPEATTKCPREAISVMANRNSSIPECPPDSQVGFAIVKINYGGFILPLEVAVYNLTPPTGVVAQFGMVVQTVPVFLTASVDANREYSLNTDLVGISQSLPFAGSTLTLWGVPNDPVHDDQRFCGASFYPGTPCSVDAARKPFLTNPSSCTGPVTSTLKVDSWQEPDVTKTASYTSGGVVGCENLRFAPSFSAAPTSTKADAPSGLAVKLALPQADDPQTGLGAPPLRDTTVTLPEGMSINPGNADGLQACTDAQLGLGTDAPVGCPEAAKIGTVTANTPVVAEPLTGSVYLRTQNSTDPESGEMFRLAMVLEHAERGLRFKLPGQVRANAATGRLETSFKNNPQQPVSSIDFTLKTGPRGVLATPATCGEQTVSARLTSWGGQVADLLDTFSVDCAPGLGGFTPTMRAATSYPLGGAFSPFALGIVKPDGNTAVTGLSMVLPTGLVAKLAGNVGTQVGSVTAYAGPGTNPYALPGQVYLEGPYGGAPYSLRVVVPAKAGPFDLGEVVVRQRVYVDPVDAHVTLVSDPMPTIVKGVPIRMQRLDVNVDKAGFMRNPTSCAPKAISAVLGSASGQAAPITMRFQASDCAKLALTPKLKLGLTGRRQLTDGKHPGVKAVLTQGAGQAGLKRVAVKLPLSLALDPANADGLCEHVESIKLEPNCPASSVVGQAKATTPLLSKPLTGPVYFAKNVRRDPKTGRQLRTLPKLVIALRGEIAINLIGESDTEKGKLVNTFAAVPDAPVSRFELSLKGGSKGILVVNGKACKRSRTAIVEVDGQNGKTADQAAKLSAPCSKAAKKAQRGARR